MPRPWLHRVVLLAAAGSLAACHRLGGPDQRFDKAESAFDDALAEKGESAWDDPRADAALAAARNVPKDSIDRAAADALVGRIETARKDEAAEKARLAKAAELVPDRAETIPTAPPPVPRERPDGGTSAPAAPPVGSSEADFHKRYGDCVRLLAPFVEAGGKREGQAFSLVPGECEARFPELKDEAVAILDGKVFNVVPIAAFHHDAPDGGTPDAGAPKAAK